MKDIFISWRLLGAFIWQTYLYIKSNHFDFLDDYFSDDYWQADSKIHRGIQKVANGTNSREKVEVYTNFSISECITDLNKQDGIALA